MKNKVNMKYAFVKNVEPIEGGRVSIEISGSRPGKANKKYGTHTSVIANMHRGAFIQMVHKFAEAENLRMAKCAEGRDWVASKLEEYAISLGAASE